VRYANLFPLSVVIRILTVTVLAGLPISAQETRSVVSTKFEVISIKPVNSARNRSPTNMDHGNFTTSNISISVLIQLEFDVRDYQILGAPGWINASRYDIVAKSDAVRDITDEEMKR
jgi:hypothetical protein